jgi:hypothetical protein
MPSACEWADFSHPIIEIVATNASGQPDGGAVLTYLTFELLNLENRDENLKLDELAAKRKISEDEWIKQTVMLEYKTLLKLKNFGKARIEPFLRKHNRAIPPALEPILVITYDPEVYRKYCKSHPAPYLESYKKGYEDLSSHYATTPTHK